MPKLRWRWQGRAQEDGGCVAVDSNLLVEGDDIDFAVIKCKKCGRARVLVDDGLTLATCCPASDDPLDGMANVDWCDGFSLTTREIVEAWNRKQRGAK